MPGRTWRDLRSNPSGGRQPSTTDTRGTTQTSPRLASLLEQRRELENRFQALTSGTGEALDPRDAARFHVPTFAERQAQQREWEAKRAELQNRATELRRQARGESAPQQQDRADAGDRGRSMDSSVSQWLSRRDAQRRSLRDAARDRLSPLNEVAGVGRQLQGSLSRASGQLRDLDRQLAAQGLTSERDELRGLGTDRLTQASSQVDKYTRMAEAPTRAVEKIDRFWENRQRDISGAMDQIGPYVDRSQRRLSTESGGSGDLFERMQRNRMRALQRRQELRREEARDEARRNRARRSRREEN